MTLCALLLLTGKSQAHDGDSTLVAPIIDGIVIDGDLSDWPEMLAAHSVYNHGDLDMPVYYDNSMFTDVDMSTSADLSPTFKVGYSPDAQLLYVGATVRDDQHLTNHETAFLGDLIEICVDGDHSGGPNLNKPGAQHLQYAGMASDQAQTSYKGNNTYISRLDIGLTRSHMAYNRKGDITTYEWAIEVFDHYPDQPAQLTPGKTIGFDVAVVDLDHGNTTVSWVTWGAFIGGKVHDANRLGDLVLDDSRIVGSKTTGGIVGTATARRTEKSLTQLDLVAVQHDQVIGMARTNKQGRFRFYLPPGEYTVLPRSGQGYEIDSLRVSVVGDDEVQADLSLVTIVLPEALTKAAARYASLTSYRDSLVVEIDGGLETTTATFAWQAPDAMRLESIDWTSGNLMAVYQHNAQQAQYASQYQQYIQQEGPGQAQFAGVQHAMKGLRLAQQLVLSDAGSTARLRQGLNGVRTVGRENMDGRATELIELELETVSGSLPFAVGHTGPLSLRLWIDVETSIIRQVQYEMDGRSYSEYYHDVELDPVISADHFTFTPPAHAEEVLYLGEGRQYDDLIGQPAPDFSLEDVDAQPVRLADYKGQVVMVDFWGTWCPPCRTAMPKLAELNDEYADQGFALIGIACQDTKKKVQAYAKKNDIKLSLPLSDGQVQKRYSVSGYPSSFLVDKQGNVRYAYIGFADGMKDKFASHIEALLAE